MRRLPRVGALLVLVGLALALFGAPAGAQDDTDPDDDTAPVSDTAAYVLEVDGLLDPILVDFVVRSIETANEVPGTIAVVLQLDSTGAIVDDAEMARLVAAMRDSEVPVSVWVGPSGAEATGAAAVLGGHAAELGIAPGSSWGLDGADVPDVLLEGALRDVPDRPLSAGEAAELGLASFDAPIIGQFLVELPDFESEVIDVDGQPARQPITAVVFTQLPLVDQLLHTVASPAVAYLLLTVGMALLVFELFTAGVGVAGLVGAGSFVAGCVGLAALPARWWAVALLVVSMVAMAVDVQTGVPRVWTGIGFALFVLGSLTLYDGLSLSWITLLVAFVGVALTFLAGMPSMVRTRFSTPTIGREWMVGEMGRAVTDVSPDGVVQVRDALWRAFTNRATPIAELDRVRVTGIEGLVLEVEPEEGGARDYRDRSPKS